MSNRTHAINRKSRKHILARAAAIAALLIGGSFATAGTTWDADGGANTAWTESTNWDGDTLPAFDGTDDIYIGTVDTIGETQDIDGDKYINSLDLHLGDPGSAVTYLTLGQPGDTLTVKSGVIQRSLVSNQVAPIVIEPDIVLETDGTFITQSSRGAVIFNGNISDGGNGYSLTFNGMGALNGVNTFSGGLTINALSYMGFDFNDVNGLGTGPVTVKASAYGIEFTGPAGSTIPNDWIIDQDSGNVDLRFNGHTLAGDVHIMQDTSFSVAYNQTYTGNWTEESPSYIQFLGGARNWYFQGDMDLDGTIYTTNGLWFQGSNPNMSADIIKDNGSWIRYYQDDSLGTGTIYLYGSTPFINYNTPTLTNTIVLDPASSSGAPTDVLLFDSDGGGGAVATWAGDILLRSDTNLQGYQNDSRLIISGNITQEGGSFALGYNAAGGGLSQLTLSGDNNFTGGTQHARGTLFIGSNTALGTGTYTITGSDANIAGLGGGTFILPNSVELQVSHANSAYDGVSGGNIGFTGMAYLTDPENDDTERVVRVRSGATLRLLGGLHEGLNGDIDLRKVDLGTLTLGEEGDYTGETYVDAGTLIARGNRAMGTSAGGTTIAGGATLAFFGGFDYQAKEAVSVGGNGVGALGAIRNLAGDNTFHGDITLTSDIRIGSDADTLTLAGDVLGGFNVTKVGNGRLDIQSSPGIANMTVSGGTLGGTPTMSGDLTFNTSTFFGLDIHALDMGYEYTQMTAAGDVALNNAFLSIAITSPVEKWQKLFIVVNDGVNPISGTFNAINDGDLIVLSPGNYARISYFGDSTTNALTGGNDIVLYDFSTTIPEPATMSLLVLGGLMLGQRRRRQA